MSLLEQGRATRRRRPSLRGAVVADLIRGVERVGAWPKKKSRRQKEKNKEIQEAFRQANWACKYMEPNMQADVAAAVKDTLFMPRDLLIMNLYGRLFAITYEDGRTMYPMAAVNDVSMSLDIIAQVPGMMLYRGPEYWVPIMPGNAGEVLTYVDPSTPPVWQDPTAENAIPLIPQPKFRLDSSSSYAINVWQGQPFIADSPYVISGIRVPIFSAAAGKTGLVALYEADAAGLPVNLVAASTVSIPLVNNDVVSIPFDAPVAIAPGFRGYIGPILQGSGPVNIMTAVPAPPGRFASGITGAPPAILTSSTYAASANNCFWTY